jgi:hypothetical protein
MLYLALAVAAVWVLAAVLGVGKNTVFKNPSSMSDAAIERTIHLSQRIMDNSAVGTKAWSESGAKFNAALNEQRRRAGLPPIGSIRQTDGNKVDHAQQPARGDEVD